MPLIVMRKYRSGVHTSHRIASEGLHEPAPAAEYDVELHGVQTDAPAELHVFGGQGVGLTELSGHAEPAGQRTGEPLEQ